MPINYVKHQKIDLKKHPELNEKWIQQIIADDPSIIGLGDLILKDKERSQPRAGRLDLLLQDKEEDAPRRFEVEIQLGKTDESHIIRTIEYWDIERKRYPQYEHSAVIIAEDITSRFLNVISLFNGAIPLIAIQMNAIEVEGKIILVFTNVLNQLELGFVDVDEEIAENTNRSFWEQKVTNQILTIVDDLLVLIKTVNANFDLYYVKQYIALIDGGQKNTFVRMIPQKNRVRVSLKIPRSDEIDAKIEGAGLEILDYKEKAGRYWISIKKDDIGMNKDVITELLKTAYENSL